MLHVDAKGAPAAAAAGIEVLMGPALAVAPSLVARLLLGLGMNESGVAIGRISGLVMLCLALGCWPSERAPFHALAPLLALSLTATIYLLYVGVGGGTVGVLLWPAAATHLVLAIFWRGPPWKAGARRHDNHMGRVSGRPAVAPPG